MILEPFEVQSGPTRFMLTDRLAIDSDLDRELVQQTMGVALAVMQEDAQCAALGLSEVGVIGNMGFGVYDGAVLVGAFLVAALDYRSGPWADLVDWQIIDSDPAVFHARPMPALQGLPTTPGLNLATDIVHHLMFRRMTTVGGHQATFSRLSWAIYKNRTDPNSIIAKRLHDHAAADARFVMTEAVDPDDPERTRVDIELR